MLSQLLSAKPLSVEETDFSLHPSPEGSSVQGHPWLTLKSRKDIEPEQSPEGCILMSLGHFTPFLLLLFVPVLESL